MIVYFSSTSENTSRFIEKLGEESIRLPLMTSEASEVVVDQDYVLITPTYGAGSKGFVPKQVLSFLRNEQNRVRCKGVIGTGNTNFFDDYCKAADLISAKLNIPVLYRFELAGTDDDVTNVREGLKQFGKSDQRDSGRAERTAEPLGS